MNAPAANPGLSTILVQLCRHDQAFVAAVIVAVLGTGYAIAAPPTWVGRIPAAVEKVVAGDNKDMRAQLAEVSGERDTLSADLAKANTSLDSRRVALDKAAETMAADSNTIGEQRARLVELERTVQDLEAAIARQAQAQRTATTELRRRTEQVAALTGERDRLGEALVAETAQAASVSNLESRLAGAMRARDATLRMVERQGSIIDGLRREAAERVAELRAGRAEQARQAATLTQVAAERDTLTASLDEQAARGNETARLRTRLAAASRANFDNERVIREQQGELAELRRNVEGLGEELQDRDAAVGRLNGQVQRLEGHRDRLAARMLRLQSRLDGTAATLASTEQTLRARVEALAATETEVARLDATLRTVAAERDTLGEQAATARAEFDRATAALAATESEFQARTGDLTAQRAELARLTATLRTVETERDSLGEQAAKLQTGIEGERSRGRELGGRLLTLNQELEASRESAAALELQLSEVREGSTLVQGRLDESSARGEAARAELTAERRRLEVQEQRIGRQTRQTAALRGEVLRLMSVLRAADAKLRRLGDSVSDRAVAGAGSVAAVTLANLGRFRSEFFGRLSTLLGDREDIQIVGDRVVFQAEVLFDSGSAEIGAGGREQLAKVATTLKELTQETPPEVNWILRVDGHTDTVPIQTKSFASNWELSAARAISVVRYLISQGVLAGRLSANGFGEFQPLDDTDSRDAHRRNRRIELKLTGR